MDMKTFQVEDTYLLVTEFWVRTVSYGPRQWPIYGPSAKHSIVGLFQEIPLKKPILWRYAGNKWYPDNAQGWTKYIEK